MSNDASNSQSKPKVIFVCSGNTCRSVLAEYIARRKFDSLAEVGSAGLPAGAVEDTDNAVYTLKELFGIDVRYTPRDVRSLDLNAFSPVVVMDHAVARELRQVFPALPLERIERLNIKDPYGDDFAEYGRCARQIYRELKKLQIFNSTPSQR